MHIIEAMLCRTNSRGTSGSLQPVLGLMSTLMYMNQLHRTRTALAMLPQQHVHIKAVHTMLILICKSFEWTLNNSKLLFVCTHQLLGSHQLMTSSALLYSVPKAGMAAVTCQTVTNSLTCVLNPMSVTLQDPQSETATISCSGSEVHRCAGHLLNLDICTATQGTG